MRTRKCKLIVNLSLSVLCLLFLWFLEERPLPDAWEYRLAEQSYFLEPKELIYVNREQGVKLSRDEKMLYLYRSNLIRQAPFQNGAAWAMAFREDGLDFYAVEESGTAVRAELLYALHSVLSHPDLCYEAEAECKDGVFRLSVLKQYEETDEAYDRAEIEHFRDLYNYLYYGDVIFSNYELTITFYDEAGAVVNTIYECGGNYDEDR